MGADDIALVRVSQLYPIPAEELAGVASRYQEATLVWCQEEPQNMGAYRFLWHHLREIFGREPLYAGRAESGSPATGSASVHKAQQARLVDEALGV